MTTPGTASNSEARKRNHPDPRCLVCGNGVSMDDALARARAEAWDEGYEVGVRDEFAGADLTENPHRAEVS